MTTSEQPEQADPAAGRLDRVLVERGLARSRGHARDLLAAGAVSRDGTIVTKASLSVGPGEALLVQASRVTVDAVGRGVLKLEEAFRRFEPQGLSAAGRRCLDVGASTGGFTQVLLDRGADHVIALDVGHDQLAPQLLADPRVRALTGHNARDLHPDLLGERVELVVVDLSFISVTTVLAAIRSVMTEGAQAVVLVKPQFEVGRGRLPKSGVVRRRPDRLRALHTVLAAAADAGLFLRDIVHSPIRGATGNREYLVWLCDRTDGLTLDAAHQRASDVVGQEEDR